MVPVYGDHCGGASLIVPLPQQLSTTVPVPVPNNGGHCGGAGLKGPLPQQKMKISNYIIGT